MVHFDRLYQGRVDDQYLQPNPMLKIPTDTLSEVMSNEEVFNKVQLPTVSSQSYNIDFSFGSHAHVPRTT